MDIRNWFNMNTLRSLAIGSGAALLLTVILSFIAGIILYLSPVSESHLQAASAAVVALSLFAGGFLSARLHGSKGLILGLLCAIVCWLILFIFGIDGLSPALSAACCLLPGMLGGLLGRS